MNDTADTAKVIIRPAIAWALAVLAGLALQWIVGMPFMPASVPVGWIGGMVFVAALALVAWAIATITRAGSNVPTNMPTCLASVSKEIASEMQFADICVRFFR